MKITTDLSGNRIEKCLGKNCETCEHLFSQGVRFSDVVRLGGCFAITKLNKKVLTCSCKNPLKQKADSPSDSRQIRGRIKQ